jgi:hypothetical protein
MLLLDDSISAPMMAGQLIPVAAKYLTRRFFKAALKYRTITADMYYAAFDFLMLIMRKDNLQTLELRV